MRTLAPISVLICLAIAFAGDASAAAAAKPTLRTATPKHEARVSGTITWRISVRPSRKVTRVRFYIDGRRIWTDKRTPFRYGRKRGRLNTLNLKNGPHRLKSIARFKDGRLRRSVRRVIVVNGLAAHSPTLTRDYAASHIRVDWPVASDADQALIFRNDRHVATRSAAVGTYTDPMLWFDTPYSYRVDLLAAGRLVRRHGPVEARTAPLPPGGYAPTMPSSNVWSSPVPQSAATSPRSAEFVAYLAARTRNANMPTREYGIPVFEAEANDPLFGPLACVYACNINDNGRVPIPDYAAPDPGSDAHMAVIAADGTSAWEYYKPLKNPAGAWASTSAGVRIDLSGEGVVPANLGGANAANFANLGGIVRPEEIAQGAIHHALALGVPGIASGRPACPAAKNVGVNDGIIPEGVRFQLDPALNIAALDIPVWQKTVARALQVYGAYVRDNAGVLSIYGETSSETLGGRRYDGWARAGSGINPGASSQVFSANFPWTSLRAIDFVYC